MYRVRFLILVVTLVLSACVSTQGNVLTPDNDQATILFLGDTSFYENYSRAREMLKEKGYDYPLENYKQILMDSDIVIANIEASITNLRDSPFEGQKQYILWQTPFAAEMFAKYNVTAAGLANNHLMDFEIEGLRETQKYLNKVGIDTFGVGENITEARKPLRGEVRLGDKAFKFTVIAGYQNFSSYDKKYAFYADENKGGVYGLDEEETANWIRSLKEAEPEQFLIVFPHWGLNYRWKGEALERLATSFIEAGADLIIAHGAHQLREVEKVQDRWVVYDLGNFMFNSWSRYQELNAPPYSLIGALYVSIGESKGLVIKLRLYPIFTDNRVTKFHGHFVTQEEFNEVRNILIRESDQPEIFVDEVQTGEDKYGYYFELSLSE